MNLPSAPCSVRAFLVVSLRCLSAPSARSHSDTSVVHELHPWNREADVTHLWKMTETSDQSRSGCRRSDRKSQERLLTLPVVPCLGLPVPYWWLLPERCSLARTHPKRLAPLLLLIVGQRGLVHDSTTTASMISSVTRYRGDQLFCAMPRALPQNEHGPVRGLTEDLLRQSARDRPRFHGHIWWFVHEQVSDGKRADTLRVCVTDNSSSSCEAASRLLHAAARRAMLIVGQRGLVHDSFGRAPHTASKIPRQDDT